LFGEQSGDKAPDVLPEIAAGSRDVSLMQGPTSHSKNALTD
jgi:hypothetical protein